MPSATRTTIIRRPVREVFAFFADPSNDMKWRPNVKEINAETTRRVGGRIHQVIAGPGGRSIPADIEITVYDPDVDYAFVVVAGPVRPEGRFQFNAIDAGSTEVTFTLKATVGGLKKLFMGGSVQKSMDGEMANLDKARQILEGSG
jgi:uncharacterized protein YndB with AHSA1/START domain